MDIDALLLGLAGLAAIILNGAYLVCHHRHSRMSLLRAESKTSAILDAAVDGIITIDKNGCIETFNAAAERIFGYERHEVIGRNVKMLMPEPYQSEHDGYLAAYKATGKPRIIGTGREVQGRRKDGSTFPMDLAVGESRNGDRRLFAGIVRDITARKATEQKLLDSEAKTRAILDTAVDGIITIDENGLVLSANPATERLFGYQAAEIIGRNINMLMPEPYHSAHDNYLKRYRDTAERRIIGIGREVEGLRKDGSTFPMDLAVGEATVGGKRIFTGIVRDITARKQAEEELRAAKDEAERANMAKSKFLAAASHDLRQPVQALVFFASALESKIGRSPAATVLGDMKGSLEALNVLLDSLLDVSRLDAGIVTPQPTNFSLSVLIDRLMTEFAPLAADKKVVLKTVPSSALVRTDPMLLGRVLQNFLTNAIRYTPRGRILIGCRRAGTAVRIQVFDTGIGIPPDRLGDIFTEFYQVGNTERDRSQGLGLGLAIVSRLSRLLDCKVEVRSKEGRGSMFSIHVPVVGYSSARNVTYLDTGGRRQDVKGVVLVIDDEVSVLKGLRMVLESWGYDVVTATAEAEALEMLNALPRPPDIIIADYRLRQGHTGAEAIVHIRSQFNRSIPALLITGDTAPERLREAEAHGLNLLHKPVQPGRLRDVLAEQMHQ